jgi:hypothetical protein
VLAVQALNDLRVVELRSGGTVFIVDGENGGTLSELTPVGLRPLSPSCLSILEFNSGALEALVTSEGFTNSIFEYTTTPVVFETANNLSSVGSPLALVSTLVTTLTSMPLFNLTSTDSEGDAGTESAALYSDALINMVLNLLETDNGSDYSTEQGEEKSNVPKTSEDLLSGTADALERLVEKIRAGSLSTPNVPPTATETNLLEEFLNFLRNQSKPNQPSTQSLKQQDDTDTPTEPTFDTSSMSNEHENVVGNWLPLELAKYAPWLSSQRIEDWSKDKQWGVVSWLLLAIALVPPQRSQTEPKRTNKK